MLRDLLERFERGGFFNGGRGVRTVFLKQVELRVVLVHHKSDLREFFELFLNLFLFLKVIVLRVCSFAHL